VLDLFGKKKQTIKLPPIAPFAGFERKEMNAQKRKKQNLQTNKKEEKKRKTHVRNTRLHKRMNE